MRPIAPRTGAEEVTLAEEQEEYMPITVALYEGAALTRWRLSEAERAAIATGQDLYLMLLTNNGPMQPVCLRVGPGDWLLEAET